MPGNCDADYKRIQRFLGQTDPREGLWRLFQEEAEFVIGDPPEIRRPQAHKTAYVGTLRDGQTKGFWALLFAASYRGRAIPCGLITYSSQTIAQGLDSRNPNHFRAFAGLKDLLGERPLALDREFSYPELLLRLVEEQVNFAIRLDQGSHAPKFWDAEGNAKKGRNGSVLQACSSCSNRYGQFHLANGRLSCGRLWLSFWGWCGRLSELMSELQRIVLDKLHPI